MFKNIKKRILDWCLSEIQMHMADIYSSSNPKNDEILGADGNIKFIGTGDNCEYFVNTPSGWSPVKRALKTVPFIRYTVNTETKTLSCADTHIVIGASGDELFVKDLEVGDKLITDTGVETVISVTITGETPEEMYDLELDDEEHVYFTDGILSHNTLTSAIYLLWRATFVPDGTYLIASKNMSHATEIASRIRFAYEELPNWLKCGLKYYNRKSIEFDNGSRIICEATTEKTGRGLSITCVAGDSLITIKQNGLTSTLPINTLPLLSNTGVTVNEHQTFFANHCGIEVLTENNDFKPFTGITKTINQDVLKVTFSDGSTLTATPDHLILIKSHVTKFKEMRGLKPRMVMSTGISVVKVETAQNCTVYDLNDVKDYASFKTNNIISKNCLLIDEISFINPRIQDELWASLVPTLSTGGSAIISSTPNGDNELFAQLWRGASDNGIGSVGTNGFYSSRVYWDEHPERDQSYYTDMVAQLGALKTRQEVDCEFLSSDALLINSMVLHKMKPKPHIYEDMGFKFWVPQESIGGNGKTYLVGVDPATGTGSDYTDIDVFEFPSMNQIAQWRSNEINVPLFYAKIKWILNFLTMNIPGKGRAECVWTFERNGIGESISTLYMNDDKQPEYAELYSDSIGKYGVFTTGQLKINTCIQLKTLFERGGISINSTITLEELKNYVAKGNSYDHKPGTTGDAVSALLVIMRLLKRLSEYDENAFKKMNEYVAPDSPESIYDDSKFQEYDQYDSEPFPMGIL